MDQWDRETGVLAVWCINILILIPALCMKGKCIIRMAAHGDGHDLMVLPRDIGSPVFKVKWCPEGDNQIVRAPSSAEIYKIMVIFAADL